MIKIIHLLKDGKVKSYFKVGEDLIPYTSGIMKYEDAEFDDEFSTLEDARYNALLYQLKRGKNLSDYKVSPYYNYYVGRLSRENPEFLI